MQLLCHILVPYALYDGMVQETLLNLLLRNYLHYNLYDQAEKLRSKAPRFEAHSNQQVTPIPFNKTIILCSKTYGTYIYV